MKSYAYVLGDARIMTYEIGDDGGLSTVGGAVDLPTDGNTAICSVGDKVFALHEADAAGGQCYLSVYQVLEGGWLTPRLQKFQLGALNAQPAIAAMALPSTGSEAAIFVGSYTGEGTALHSYKYTYGGQNRSDTIAQVGTSQVPGNAGVIEAMQADVSERFLYAALSGGDVALASFSVNAVGAATYKARVPSAAADELVIAVHPTGKFVYSASFARKELIFYRAERGVLTPPAGSGEWMQGPASAMTIGADGKYLFVSTVGGTNEVIGFTIDPSSGMASLPKGQPAASGITSLAVTLDGKYVYAVCDNESERDSQVYRFDVDGAGKLSSPSVAANTYLDNEEIIIVQR